MTAAAAVVLVAALTLAGCSENREGTGERALPEPGAAASSAARSAAPSGPPGCVRSVEQATVRAGDPPSETCLVVGAELWVYYAPGDWGPLAVSDPSILSCAAREPGAVCRALAPGTAVLSVSRDGATWRLTARVVSAVPVQ